MKATCGEFVLTVPRVSVQFGTHECVPYYLRQKNIVILSVAKNLSKILRRAASQDDKTVALQRFYLAFYMRREQS